MYVRVATFEGNDPATVDQRAAAMRATVEATMAGGNPDGMPEEAAETLRSCVSRVMMVVDRETGAEASLVFCETEDDLRRVDAVLQQMSPPQGEDIRRAGLGRYEALVDVTG